MGVRVWGVGKDSLSHLIFIDEENKNVTPDAQHQKYKVLS